MIKNKKPKFKKWKRRELILFLEQVGLYISCGLPVTRAIEICKDGRTKGERAGLEALVESVQSGQIISLGLRHYLGISPTLCALIEHGSASGGLEKSLHAARTLLEREEELIKKCLSAMTYPIVIGIFALLLVFGLVRGIMPQIIPMLLGLHVSLPLLTRVVITFSDYLTHYGIYAAAVIILAYVILAYLYRRHEKTKMIVQRIFLMIPLAGKLLYNYTLTVFLRAEGALIESGVSVPVSSEKTVCMINLIGLREALNIHIDEVGRGVSLGTVLARIKMPAFVPQLIAAGEASGTLGRSIIRAADILDRDIEHTLKKLTALIEPVLMVAMGAVVGAIALSIMMPIYDISKVLQK